MSGGAGRAVSALLDTQVLIRWLGGIGQLSREQTRAIRRADPDDPVLVSDISLWEIVVLCELGRIELDLPLRDWLERAVAPPLVRRVGISPAVAAGVAALPPSFHRDPADRIIVATARTLGASIVTSDDRIVSARLVPTIS